MLKRIRRRARRKCRREQRKHSAARRLIIEALEERSLLALTIAGVVEIRDVPRDELAAVTMPVQGARVDVFLGGASSTLLGTTFTDERGEYQLNHPGARQVNEVVSVKVTPQSRPLGGGTAAYEVYANTQPPDVTHGRIPKLFSTF